MLVCCYCSCCCIWQLWLRIIAIFLLFRLSLSSCSRFYYCCCCCCRRGPYFITFCLFISYHAVPLVSPPTSFSFSLFSSSMTFYTLFSSLFPSHHCSLPFSSHASSRSIYLLFCSLSLSLFLPAFSLSPYSFFTHPLSSSSYFFHVSLLQIVLSLMLFSALFDIKQKNNVIYLDWFYCTEPD